MCENFPRTTMHAIQLSLKSQVLAEVQKCLYETKAMERVHAAREVVDFLTSSALSETVEVSVEFVDELITCMIVYVSNLIREFVYPMDSDVAPADTTAILEGDILLCDSLLRSLRNLQEDMTNRIAIHEGTFVPKPIIHRRHNIPPGRLGGVDNSSHIDKVVERSLLTRSCSSGYHFTRSVRENAMTGELIRCRARLIAYLFICSQQLDSFFIGIDLLRQSGQHVSNVLTAIFLNTSSKFVRDRIWGHLSHKQFSNSIGDIVETIRELEKWYPINCYDTQLNRRWAAIETVVVGEGTPTIESHPLPPLTECGTISDVPSSILGDHVSVGNIGNLSLDESNQILRCTKCSLESVMSAEPGDGYLHLTVAWLKRMKPGEIKRIKFEQNNDADLGVEEKFSFLFQKHDWYGLTQLLDNVQQLPSTIPFTIPSNSPIGSLIEEKIFAASNHSTSTPESLAKVGLLFTGESKTVSHAMNLAWLMREDTGIPPQVLPMYLRRWGDSYIDAKTRGRFAIPILGRQGVAQLPQVSRLMTSPESRHLIELCEMMFEGMSDDDEKLDAIVKNFPQLGPFLLPPIPEPPAPLRDSIYKLTTFCGDVAIHELLADVYPRWTSWEVEELTDTQAQQPYTVEYLLAQGRPSRAFMLDVHKDSKSLQRSARRVAFYNLFNDGVVASAISFLDLCGEATETLRVDIQAARSILGQSYLKARRDEVVDVFLSFQEGQHSENLLRALKMLEEAAWVQEPPTGSLGGSPLDNLTPPPVASSAAGAGESPWHLVALFCRVHSLPRSLTLLHELARNGDWVMFLHESDLQQCPIDTVRDVVRLYFVDNPLRNHLNILLEGEADAEIVEVGGEVDSLGEWSPEKTDIPLGDEPKIQLKKFLSLYQFENARKFIESSGDKDSLLLVLHGVSGGESFLYESEVKALTRIASVFPQDSSIGTPISTDEEDDIGSLDASSFKGTLRGTSSSSSGVMVESLLTDDEDEAILLEEIRQALAAGSGDSIESIRNKVDNEGVFRQVYSMLVNHMVKNVKTREEEFLSLVRIVSMDVREGLGRFLMAQLMAEDSLELDSVETRRDICILAYYALSTSFCNDSLDELIEMITSDVRLESTRLDIAEHVIEIRWQRLGDTMKADKTTAANGMLETTRRRLTSNCTEPGIADLQCLLKVARVYKERDMLGQYLVASVEAQAVLERLKSSILV